MKVNQPKAYELHESVYRDLRKKNLKYWLDNPSAVPPPVENGIDVHDERFLEDVLAQEWAPNGGKAIELGCGSGPMLRWLSRKGFRGLGVDISPTAVLMATEQSRRYKGLRFLCADILHNPLGTPRYDLALDGRWLHCLTQPADRRVALAIVRKLLRKGGVFIVLSMCAPVRTKRFATLYPTQILRNHIVYQAFQGAERYEGCQTLKGHSCLPLRYIAHWKDILREVKDAAFEPALIRLSKAYGDEVTSFLCLAAIAV